MKEIHDQYGNPLQVGDHVCFLHKTSTNGTELVRAKVEALEEETGKRAEWTEGWVIISEIQPEYLREKSPWRPRPLPKKKAASCCIKCY